jgi:hypothetical protein
MNVRDRAYIDRPFGVAANHLSMRDIAPPIGKQNLPPKTPEMPSLSRYFAFRDRN